MLENRVKYFSIKNTWRPEVSILWVVFPPQCEDVLLHNEDPSRPAVTPAPTAEESVTGCRAGTAARQPPEPLTPFHSPSSLILEGFFPSPSHSLNTSHTDGLVTIYIQTKTHCSLKGQSETSGKLHGVFIFPFFVCHSVFVSKSVCGIFRSKRCFLFRTCRESVDEKLTFTTPDFFGCHCCLGKT